VTPSPGGPSLPPTPNTTRVIVVEEDIMESPREADKDPPPGTLIAIYSQHNTSWEVATRGPREMGQSPSPGRFYSATTSSTRLACSMTGQPPPSTQ